nr:MAG TPA: hypothetical protein [Caudoviricetes sp.]
MFGAVTRQTRAFSKIKKILLNFESLKKFGDQISVMCPLLCRGRESF